MSEALPVLGISGAVGLAAFLGAALAVRYQPTTFLMSVAFGFAGGILLATVAFEMMPGAYELSSRAEVLLGFAAGFGAIYVLDLYMNDWRLAGPQASEGRKIESSRKQRRVRSKQATVLALGTSVEEVIEGIAIGVGLAIGEGVGLVLALAIAIDNVTEAFSIGAMLREDTEASASGSHESWRIFAWSAAPGVSVFLSSLFGWALLGGLPDRVLAALLAVGAGSLFYLTVTDFIPEAEERQYQQSAAVSAAAGFVAIYALSSTI